MVFSSQPPGPKSESHSLERSSPTAGLAEGRRELAQFRARYPSASLISELLQIYEGHYVVRVSIHQDNILLVTGLASAAILEQAEDRARLRAIEGLGISAPIPYPLASLSEIPSSPLVEAPLSQRSVLTSLAPTSAEETHSFVAMEDRPPSHGRPISPGTQSPLPTRSEEESAETEFDDDFSEGNSFVPHRTEFYGEDEPDAVPEEFRMGGPSGVSPSEDFRGADLYQDFTAEALPSPSKSIALPPLGASDTFSSPIDMSDIIAQTDLEMKRVGWTRARGRSYLIETYGKKTRQELDDDELMEFLEFLKMQPTAEM